MDFDSKGFSHRPRTLAPLLLLAGLLLAGCAPRVYVEQDKQAALGGYHSFAWVSPQATPVKDPILDSQILESRVRHAVSTQLGTRGYQEVAADANPDFLITYHTASKQKLESTGPSFSFGIVDTFPRGFGSVAFPVGGEVESRDEGTLMVDVIDGKSKRLVWRGWISGWLNQDNYTDEAVGDAIKRILDKFPGG